MRKIRPQLACALCAAGATCAAGALRCLPAARGARNRRCDSDGKTFAIQSVQRYVGELSRDETQDGTMLLP